MRLMQYTALVNLIDMLVFICVFICDILVVAVASTGLLIDEIPAEYFPASRVKAIGSSAIRKSLVKSFNDEFRNHQSLKWTTVDRFRRFKIELEAELEQQPDYVSYMHSNNGFPDHFDVTTANPEAAQEIQEAQVTLKDLFNKFMVNPGLTKYCNIWPIIFRSRPSLPEAVQAVMLFLRIENASIYLNKVRARYAYKGMVLTPAMHYITKYYNSPHRTHFELSRAQIEALASEGLHELESKTALRNAFLDSITDLSTEKIVKKIPIEFDYDLKIKCVLHEYSDEMCHLLLESFARIMTDIPTPETHINAFKLYIMKNMKLNPSAMRQAVSHLNGPHVIGMIDLLRSIRIQHHIPSRDVSAELSAMTFESYHTSPLSDEEPTTLMLSPVEWNKRRDALKDEVDSLRTCEGVRSLFVVLNSQANLSDSMFKQIRTRAWKALIGPTDIRTRNRAGLTDALVQALRCYQLPVMVAGFNMFYEEFEFLEVPLLKEIHEDFNRRGPKGIVFDRLLSPDHLDLLNSIISSPATAEDFADFFRLVLQPSVTYIHQQALPQEQCSICIEAFQTELAELTCGHRFHVQCVAQWLRSRHTCPNCRTDVPDSYVLEASVASHHSTE